MRTSFDYLLDKITAAEFRTDPFRHLWIDEWFTPDHFSAITASPQIDVSGETDEAVLGAVRTGIPGHQFPRMPVREKRRAALAPSATQS